jgi:3-oxoacyl-[acyl-carrier protein] reductase
MSDDRAVVTGASRGIGRAVARRFVRSGTRVVGVARDRAALSELRRELGSLFEPRPVDLLEPTAMSELCAMLADEQVMTLVNNAGANVSDTALAIDPAVWSRVVELNVTVPMRLAQSAAVGMVARRTGRIVNIGSVWGLRGRAGRATYATTKTALLGLTRTMACDLAPHGVLVNAVCPGPADTELTAKLLTAKARAELIASIPIGRLADPDEIASLVYYLGSGQNTYITGQAIAIDGALTAQ